MVSLHIRLGTFGTRADMLADLNLSGNKRHAMTWEEEVSAGVIAEVQQKIAAAADRAGTLTVKDEIFTVRGPE